MAAGLGFKTFNTGDVLSAADTNGYLMQGVLVFANAAARDAAITSPQEGQCCYLKDTDAVQTYSGTAWVGFDDSNAIQNSLVDAKGDIVAASGNDTPARLAVGNNGETLVADSSTATGLRWQGDYAAGKNKIINGDFGVWQRGTSFSNPSAGAYTADRWSYIYDGTGATRTISQQTFTPATAPVTGYEGTFFFRAAVSVAGTGNSYQGFIQKIEDVRTFANQTATLSFWAKADTSRTLSVDLEQNFGSGGSSAVYLSAQNASLTTSWTRFSLTYNVPSISGKTVGTSSFLGLRFFQPSASTSTIDIWGVQLESGSTATAFQTATGTLQGELAACQRYYSKSYNTETAPTTSSTVSAVSMKTAFTNSFQNFPAVFFKTTMRVSPTVTLYSTGGTSGKIRSNAGGGTDLNGASQYIGANSFVAYVDNSSVSADIELRFHYVAEAEL